MKTIMFKDKFKLTEAVLKGSKTMTRREPIFFDGDTLQGIVNNRLHLYEESTKKLLHKSYYAVGEVVAISQSYKDIFTEADNGDYWADCYEMFRQFTTTESAGYYNKMFIRADIMPHHIRITDIKVERLQDISDEDCEKEGVYQSSWNGYYCYTFRHSKRNFHTRREAFAALIDKVSGRGTWDRNPYVFVYSFELNNGII